MIVKILAALLVTWMVLAGWSIHIGRASITVYALVPQWGIRKPPGEVCKNHSGVKKYNDYWVHCIDGGSYDRELGVFR